LSFIEIDAVKGILYLRTSTKICPIFYGFYLSWIKSVTANDAKIYGLIVSSMKIYPVKTALYI